MSLTHLANSSEKSPPFCRSTLCECMCGGGGCLSLQDLNEDRDTHQRGSNCPPQEMSDRHEYFIVAVFRSDRRLNQIYSKCGLIGTHDRTAAIRLCVWLMTLSMTSGSLSPLLLSSCVRNYWNDTDRLPTIKDTPIFNNVVMPDKRHKVSFHKTQLQNRFIDLTII